MPTVKEKQPMNTRKSVIIASGISGCSALAYALAYAETYELLALVQPPEFDISRLKCANEPWRREPRNARFKKGIRK